MTGRAKVVVWALIAAVAVVLLGGSILTATRSRPTTRGVPQVSAESTASTVSSASVSASKSPSSTASSPTAPSPAAAPGSAPAKTAPRTAPPEPAPDGQTLEKLVTPPTKTIAFIQSAAAGAGDSYDIVFVPFGYGPSGEGRSLAVKIERSTPVGKPKRTYPFAGRNVLLSTALAKGQTIKTGGRYSGTIELVRDGDVLVPTLTRLQ